MELVYPQGSTFAQKRRIDAMYAINQYLLASMLSDTDDAHIHRTEAAMLVGAELDRAAELLERSTEDLEDLRPLDDPSSRGILG